MSASDWATIANLATALGTLVLAVATFSAVELLYGDHEGGQLAVTRFTMLPLSMHPDADPPGGSAGGDTDPPGGSAGVARTRLAAPRGVRTRRWSRDGSRPRAGTGTSTDPIRDNPTRSAPGVTGDSQAQPGEF